MKCSQPLLVSYAVGGSGRNGVDYPLLLGVVEIPAGKKSVKLLVRPSDDGLTEGSESLELKLLPGDGYSLPLVAEAAVEFLDPKSR